MTILPRLSAATGALILALPALAGRPLQTEDAGVLDTGGCEVEGVVERVRLDGGTARARSLVANCGVGLRSQLGIGGGWWRALGERSRSAGLGGKTRLWAGDSDGAPAFTLAWAVGADRTDGRWRRSGYEVKAVASVGAGPGTLHANLGHAREREPRRSLTTWNLAWEHEGLTLGGITLAPMAEVFGDDRGDAWWNLAARLTLVPERLFVDASYGRQTNANKARLFTVGFKLAF
jgi:hypothetical protein